MKISRIKLENWRNFGHVDVPLQNRAFLVGPNASGKSNFLDGIRFLRDLVLPGGGLQKSVADRGGVSSIRNLAARRYPDVALEAELAEGEHLAWRYRLAFAQDNQGSPILKQEQVWQDERVILNRPSPDDLADEARLRQTHLEQTIANQAFRDIADFFSTIRYYHIVPQLVRDPERSIGRHADPYGGDFLAQMAQTRKNTRDARLKRIQRALQVAVPQLTELKLEQDKRGTPHLYGKYEHWRPQGGPQGGWQTEADFSDGTLRLMGLLWALLEGSGPLLLEEPELSLHSDIVRYIAQMMVRVQRERKKAPRQILISTHSSDLLRDEGIAADEVLLFRPATEGTEVQVGADIQEVCALLGAGLTAADAVIPLTRPKSLDQLPLF